MRTFFAAILMLAGALAQAAPPASNHPILGIWQLELPDGSCTEVYRFRGDGTTLVMSAAEVSESEFQIPAQPSAKGFYKLTDKITKDNGKKDCSGEVMKIGTSVTNYVRFNTTGTVFVMCMEESLERCIGPFIRMQGEEI